MVITNPCYRIFLIFCFLQLSLVAQLKYIVEDFEGLATDNKSLAKNGVFAYGNINAAIQEGGNTGSNYINDRFITLSCNAEVEHGGWGKGMNTLIELNRTTDHFNFFCNYSGKKGTLCIELREDDNGDGIYQETLDDAWIWEVVLKPTPDSDPWNVFSVPLDDLKDRNTGGDGTFNCSYKGGKLLELLFVLDHLQKNEQVSFDFLNFSYGKFVKANGGDGTCALGFWAKEDDVDVLWIPNAFEKMFGKEKKLAVVHFFQPLATDGGSIPNNYPAPKQINELISAGYQPMITLENRYVNVSSKARQPNLYSITEGHLDAFFIEWAKHIKKVNGIVLVRILHEFNGNWYPWCLLKNDRDPKLFVKAFRHMHDLFVKENVTNVRFIWCPNSMSVPQESWNYIMDAYPGDEYVDLLGMDIYNGADQDAVLWRSFRKEGIENYFLFSQQVKNKEIIVCEAASRERKHGEGSNAQTKEQWIFQMAGALKTDMSRVRLLGWFNEKKTFKLNSSKGSLSSFREAFIRNPYFESGSKESSFLKLIR